MKQFFNFLRAVADGISTGLSSSGVVSRYNLGSSANVAAIVRLLVILIFRIFAR